jgi:hypothetical protein
MLHTDALQQALLFLPRYMLDVVTLVNRLMASIVASDGFSRTAALRSFEQLTFPSETHIELFEGGRTFV